MTKQYTVTVNGTAYEVTVESVSGGRMASAPVARTASAPVAALPLPSPLPLLPRLPLPPRPLPPLPAPVRPFPARCPAPSST